MICHARHAQNLAELQRTNESVNRLTRDNEELGQEVTRVKKRKTYYKGQLKTTNDLFLSINPDYNKQVVEKALSIQLDGSEETFDITAFDPKKLNLPNDFVGRKCQLFGEFEGMECSEASQALKSSLTRLKRQIVNLKSEIENAEYKNCADKVLQLNEKANEFKNLIGVLNKSILSLAESKKNQVISIYRQIQSGWTVQETEIKTAFSELREQLTLLKDEINNQFHVRGLFGLEPLAPTPSTLLELQQERITKALQFTSDNGVEFNLSEMQFDHLDPSFKRIIHENLYVLKHPFTTDNSFETTFQKLKGLAESIKLEEQTLQSENLAESCEVKIVSLEEKAAQLREALYLIEGKKSYLNFMFSEISRLHSKSVPIDKLVDKLYWVVGFPRKLLNILNFKEVPLSASVFFTGSPSLPKIPKNWVPSFAFDMQTFEIDTEHPKLTLVIIKEAIEKNPLFYLKHVTDKLFELPSSNLKNLELNLSILNRETLEVKPATKRESRAFVSKLCESLLADRKLFFKNRQGNYFPLNDLTNIAFELGLWFRWCSHADNVSSSKFPNCVDCAFYIPEKELNHDQISEELKQKIKILVGNESYLENGDRFSVDENKLNSIYMGVKRYSKGFHRK